MNQTYQELKKQYDAISEEILALHDKQQSILALMRENCPHERFSKVEQDPFGLDTGWEEEAVQYKCKDCYRYFTKEKLPKEENHGFDK